METRKLKVALAVCLAVVFAGSAVFAQDVNKGSQCEAMKEGSQCEAMKEQAESVEKTQAVEVGNKICPISGRKIKEEMKASYEHEGKIYNFCCAMCIKSFKKDPEKYIEKLK